MPAFDKIIPVIPPNVDGNMKPIAKSIGAFDTIAPPHIVAIQLKILIPVGMAITIVAAVRYALVFVSMPEVYM